MLPIDVSSMHWNRTMKVQLEDKSCDAAREVTVTLSPETTESIREAIREELAKMNVELMGDVWVSDIAGFATRDLAENAALTEAVETEQEVGLGQELSLQRR